MGVRELSHPNAQGGVVSSHTWGLVLEGWIGLLLIYVMWAFVYPIWRERPVIVRDSRDRPRVQRAMERNR